MSKGNGIGFYEVMIHHANQNETRFFLVGSRLAARKIVNVSRLTEFR